MTSPAHEAIVNYVLDPQSAHGINPEALRLALLTRDSFEGTDGIFARVCDGFHDRLAKRLKAIDPTLKIENGFRPDCLRNEAGIQCRRDRWPAIQRPGNVPWQYHLLFAFEKRNFRSPFVGLFAPMGSGDIKNAEQRPEPWLQLENALHPFFPGNPNYWWIGWKSFGGGWTQTETILRLAGAEPYEGIPLDEWVSERFLEILREVDKVVRST